MYVSASVPLGSRAPLVGLMKKRAPVGLCFRVMAGTPWAIISFKAVSRMRWMNSWALSLGIYVPLPLWAWGDTGKSAIKDFKGPSKAENN